MTRRPPRSTPTATPFPCTPLFRSTEDSSGCNRAWRGAAEPAGELVLSEPAIIARLAEATLTPNPMLDWDAWVADYSLIRDAIAESYPEIFHDFNVRMMEPGGNGRSEEHTSELQSLMRISYAVFCLKNKITLAITTTSYLDAISILFRAFYN